MEKRLKLLRVVVSPCHHDYFGRHGMVSMRLKQIGFELRAIQQTDCRNPFSLTSVQ